MGREMVGIKVYATLSSHNSEQDDLDQALWDDLTSRIKAMCGEPKYDDIRPDTV